MTELTDQSGHTALNFKTDIKFHKKNKEFKMHYKETGP